MVTKSYKTTSGSIRMLQQTINAIIIMNNKDTDKTN